MTIQAEVLAVTPPQPPYTIKRHTGLVRLTHWIWAFAILVLIFTGFLSILAEYSYLFWGDDGYCYDASYAATTNCHDTLSESFLIEPITNLKWVVFRLAYGKSIHLFAAWFLVFSGLVYFVVSMTNRHFKRAFVPSRQQLRWSAVLADIKHHAMFRRSTGEATRNYNLFQKLAYIAVVFIFVPLSIYTGLVMSPLVVASYPGIFLWMGRQTARTVHFFSAIAVTLFVIVHVFQVFVAGFSNHMRSMITGRYVIHPEVGS